MQPSLFNGRSHNDRVSPYQWSHRVVSTPDHSGDWNVSAERCVQNQMISLEQSRICQIEPSKAVVAMGVDPCVEQH
tara:strand:+ start:440 stop:667 length:228 start_codon:yes stop_codon:yes gene_type:complete